MYTKQETFNIVVKALRKQGKPCVDQDGDCYYRGPNGMKCAAGHLIPEDKYMPIMEGENALNGRPAECIIAEGHDIHLVAALQDAHDCEWNNQGETKFRNTLKEIAAGHDLSYTPDDEVGF